jgi:hypothetical protein
MNHAIALTEQARRLIGERVPQAQETDRAEASLVDLSFQSTVHPDRHIWISFFPNDNYLCQIDLEDWRYQCSWDNALARITMFASEMACLQTLPLIVTTWFSGSSVPAIKALLKATGLRAELSVEGNDG